MRRLFTGLPIPPDVTEQLALMQGGIAGARWNVPADFHLTLTFLGEVADDDLEDLDRALFAATADPFVYTLKGTGAFAQGQWPNVLWMGVAAPPELAALKNSIDAQLRQTRIDFEKRNYAPHVTMARLRHADDTAVAGFMQQHNLYRSRPITVESFMLYESLSGRSPGEQRYIPVEEYALSS